MSDLDTIKHIKAKHEYYLLSKKNVVGVGLGKKNQTTELCIKVYVSIKEPESKLNAEDIVPAFIDNVKTDVIETGNFYFQQANQFKKR